MVERVAFALALACASYDERTDEEHSCIVAAFSFQSSKIIHVPSTPIQPSIQVSSVFSLAAFS